MFTERKTIEFPKWLSSTDQEEEVRRTIKNEVEGGIRSGLLGLIRYNNDDHAIWKENR